MDAKQNRRENDGFTFILYKGKRKKKASKNNRVLPSETFSKSAMHKIQNEVEESPFFLEFKDTFFSILNHGVLSCALSKNSTCDDLAKALGNVTLEAPNDVDVVCYGLGNFLSCKIALYQLGFLLALKCALGSRSVVVYDPRFSAEEVAFLKELDLDVLQNNEEGKRRIERRTVFFMPHCDLPLYNNLLWINWNVQDLLNLILIGNSFQNYKNKNSKNTFQKRAQYVYWASHFGSEVQLSNTFKFKDIFNDLATHYFQRPNLVAAAVDVWKDVAEPEYSDEDKISIK